jgi:hypothetical protein
VTPAAWLSAPVAAAMRAHPGCPCHAEGVPARASSAVTCSLVCSRSRRRRRGQTRSRAPLATAALSAAAAQRRPAGHRRIHSGCNGRRAHRRRSRTPTTAPAAPAAPRTAWAPTLEAVARRRRRRGGRLRKRRRTWRKSTPASRATTSGALPPTLSRQGERVRHDAPVGPRHGATRLSAAPFRRAWPQQTPRVRQPIFSGELGDKIEAGVRWRRRC